MRKRLAALASVLIAPPGPVAFAGYFALVIAALFLASLILRDSPPDGPKMAAIVDQVSIYDANPEFVAAATDTLEGAGYVVDYYPHQEVTVDLYRDLPAYGYDLIVLRAHSARMLEDWQGKPVDEMVIFTSEPFTLGKYDDDIRSRSLASVSYSEDSDESFFGIESEFVLSRMRGDLAGTTIIMMGCDGLTTQNATARAFLDRGAKAFISWDDLISWDHSDATTERLLELMLVDGLDADEAVTRTAAELGPDPVFGAELRILTGDG